LGIFSLFLWLLPRLRFTFPSLVSRLLFSSGPAGLIPRKFLMRALSFPSTRQRRSPTFLPSLGIVRCPLVLYIGGRWRPPIGDGMTVFSTCSRVTSREFPLMCPPTPSSRPLKLPAVLGPSSILGRKDMSLRQGPFFPSSETALALHPPSFRFLPPPDFKPIGSLANDVPIFGPCGVMATRFQLLIAIFAPLLLSSWHRASGSRFSSFFQICPPFFHHTGGVGH